MLTPVPYISLPNVYTPHFPLIAMFVLSCIPAPFSLTHDTALAPEALAVLST